jgi:hypothetical protein
MKFQRQNYKKRIEIDQALKKLNFEDIEILFL